VGRARVVEAVVAMAVVVALAVTVGALMASAAVVAVLTVVAVLPVVASVAALLIRVMSVALVQLQLIPLGQDCFSLHVPMC
jgi:hypothetical protein